MKPSALVQLHREEIRRVAMRHCVSNLRIFGSVAQGNDREGSDLDLLVDAGEKTTLYDLVALEKSLATLLGIPVDVQTPTSISKRFRGAVLNEAIPL
jgi:predicted nucleotidyltransferase